ncbi:LPXTG cell wall anchor domain-containing protein [Collinsella tanakaei]
MAGRKDSIAPRLPQTGDANLMPPLVFAGIIGVALLGASIALLFDKRK